MNVRAMLVSGVLATGLGGLFTQGAFARDTHPAPDQHRVEVRVDDNRVADRDNHDRDDHFVDRDDRYVQVDRFDRPDFDRHDFDRHDGDHHDVVIHVDHDRR